MERPEKAPKKGHDLASLFASLSHPVQQEIVRQFVSANPEETDATVAEQLLAHRNVFVDWRYAFEAKADLECSPNFLYSFGYCLSQYIAKQHGLALTENGWRGASAG